MPSPFPGMDPYLESPQFWRGAHALLIAEINAALNRQLPRGYAADIDERVYLQRVGSDGRDTVLPDVTLTRTRPGVTDRVPIGTTGTAGGVALMTAETLQATEPERLTVIPIRERFVTISSVSQPSEIITIIEVLSPSNKTIGSAGRLSYVSKQQQTLQSDANLLEIDLLRQGGHMVAPPLEDLREFGTWNYLVSLSRAAERTLYKFWRISLRTPLPAILVPLAASDPDVVLDLQAAFARAYESGPYARRIDYAQSPDVPFEDEEDAMWADTLLREKDCADVARQPGKDTRK